MNADATVSPVITLCVLTYRRPVGVAQMLAGTGRLMFKGPAPDLRIVIVDNDPDGSSRQAVVDAAEGIPWPVRYCIEPLRGITYARNRALDEAAGSEWICFIDDDEMPNPDWLDELLRVQREHDADVVGGPVVSEFPPETPRWIMEGGFFDPMRYATGTPLPYCFTNNVLFRARILHEPSLRFDHRFALTGGEDRDFFQRVGRAGYRIVWADDAIVSETVPESRANATWVLRRSYRNGMLTVTTDSSSMGGVATGLYHFVRAYWLVARGGFFLLLLWPLGRKHSIRCLQGVYWGGGMLAALAGSKYAEYKTIHGH